MKPVAVVAADTGGTFTDCLVEFSDGPYGPYGGLRRSKVLSTGAVRGRLVEIAGEHLRITAPWSAVDGFFRGATARSLASGQETPLRDSTESGWLLAGSSLHGFVLGETLEFFADATSPASAGHERLEAPVLAARLALGVPLDRPLPPLELRLATTRGTNALLERRGARVAFFVTAGFADLLAIGTQERADLFSLAPRRPEPLYATVVEVDERLAADGSILRQLNESELRRAAGRLRAAGFDCAAVALMHADRHAEHEKQVVRVLAAEGFRWLARSSTSPFRRIVPRAQTAVVDAYLAPLLEDYVARVAAQAGKESRVWLLNSSGGLVRPASYRGSESLFSGPAGGVVGAVAAGNAAGFSSVLGFDMGGTSTDVARADGQPSYRFSSRVGEVEVLVPSVAIATVAAGGGSIIRLDGARLAVGPESAGADPGPACYGAGGPLTVTDANLLLGRLRVEGFEVPVDTAAAEARAEALARAAGVDVEDLLLDALAIADERMAAAIRDVSTREGFDPRAHTLVAFGGAGGQHACRIAELLGIERVLAPEDASLLSARGLIGARVERFAERQLLRSIDSLDAGSWRALWQELEEEARNASAADGVAPSEIEIVRRLGRVRLVGQDSALEVAVSATGGLGDLDRAFGAAYREVFGDLPPDRGREIESIRLVAAKVAAKVTAGGTAAARTPDGERESAQRQGSQLRRTRVRSAAGWVEVPLLDRADLPAAGLRGPLLIVERFTGWWVEAGWSVEPASGSLLLLRTG